jgi:hypothetical protein
MYRVELLMTVALFLWDDFELLQQCAAGGEEKCTCFNFTHIRTSKFDKQISEFKNLKPCTF